MAASEEYQYQQGFGNHFTSEALKDALPKGQNTPQVVPYGLYAEQLSGTSFTTPRHKNQRTWFYRIRPSANHEAFKEHPNGHISAEYVKTTPNQLRWMPMDIPTAPTDFVEGIHTVAGCGDISTKTGLAVHLYVANTDMVNKAFCCADGDVLIVPQQGRLNIRTEFGYLMVPPNFICVIQRGMRFSVALPDGPSRGYMCEVYDSHFVIPDLGPIGANGLANPRDFQSPVASFEDRECEFTIVHKFLGNLYTAKMTHSPFDVVAWHGNYVPYRYDLALFCAVNSVTFDHMDPSIFTVLSAPTAHPGVAACDFVIFPPRWSVQEHTFRPPYYHRNIMSEYMGLILGAYEAKVGGFVPGGSTLHSIATPHGPDAIAYGRAVKDELVPKHIADNTQAFMFESYYTLKLTHFGANTDKLDRDYNKCWEPLVSHFDPNWKPTGN